MSLNFTELAISRSVEKSTEDASETLEYIGAYSNDQDAVYAALFLISPKFFDGLRRKKIGAKPVGGGVWMGTVEYGSQAAVANNTTDSDKPQNPGNNPLGPEFNFDTTGGTIHITQSLKTNSAVAVAINTTGGHISGTNLTVDGANNLKVTPDGYAPVAGDVGKKVAVTSGTGWTVGTYTITAQGGGQWTLGVSPAATSTAGGVWGLLTTSPNYRQAIGVTTDGVEGTDITARKLEFTLTGNWYPLQLSYIATLYQLTGCINNAVWWGFKTGEVQYLGANGQCTDGQSFKITHKFAASPNLTNVVISPDLILPTKGGWDYLWNAYEPSNDANFPVMIPRVTSAEQVYRTGDFSLLGMGT